MAKVYNLKIVSKTYQLTINFENQEKTNKKPFGKIEGSPKRTLQFMEPKFVKKMENFPKDLKASTSAWTNHKST
jgi:hypothetical protein